MASCGPPFIDRENFLDLLKEIPRKRGGGNYEDRGTIYRDMSRLVVGLLATTSPSEIRKLYNDVGWKGSGNAYPIHEAAKQWMQIHHPQRLKRVLDAKARKQRKRKGG